MTVEDSYFLLVLGLASAGAVAASVSMGRGAAAIVLTSAVLIGIGAALLPSGMAIGMLGIAVPTLIVSGHARLGWLALRRPGWWMAGVPVMAVQGLLGIGGLLLMTLYPGTGYLANLGYNIAMLLLAAPAAIGTASGMAAAALTRSKAD